MRGMSVNNEQGVFLLQSKAIPQNGSFKFNINAVDINGNESVNRVCYKLKYMLTKLEIV